MERIFRFDYAKFIIECSPDNWNALYGQFRNARDRFKAAGDFDKAHKTTRLYFNAQAGKETWALEVWGEWAGIVQNLPAWWASKLKRLDVRAVMWDADSKSIRAVGQHLVAAALPYNVTQHNRRPSTKRQGRDRGGVGFAIGSHKSDLRVTCYKAGNEPCAIEFQMTGRYLERVYTEACAEMSQFPGVASVWLYLREGVQREGERRLTRSMEMAGIGVYWPMRQVPEPELPPLEPMMELGDGTYVPYDDPPPFDAAP